MARKQNIQQRWLGFGQRGRSEQGATRAVAGFTLVETMMALIILMLLTAVVASGIPVASQTYTKAVDASNAQVALTTTAAKLREELSLAQDVFFVRAGEGTEREVKLFKTSDGYWATIENPTGDEKGLYVQAYYGVPDETIGTAPYGMVKIPADKNGRYPLIPDSAMVGNLKVTLDATKTPNITYNYETGVFTVNGLTVTQSGTNTELGTAGSSTYGKLYIRAALY